MSADPRSGARRRCDTEYRLSHDVSIIVDDLEVLEIYALPQAWGDRLVAHTGFDPRALAPA